MSGTHTLENLVIYTVYLTQIKSYLKKNANYLVYFKILNGMNTSIRIPNCLTLARPRRISALREKCPKTKFFLIRIFPHSEWIRRDTPYLSVFSPNAGKYGPEKTPCIDTFHAVLSRLDYGNLTFNNISNRLLKQPQRV